MTEQRSVEVVLEDPLRPGMAAAARAGDLVFLGSVDGVSDHLTGEIDHSVFGDGPAQARRAYSAVVERLEACGLGGSSAIRIEHATASQDWRLQRMALWPEHFGTPTRSVSQGYQGKMAGRNMITVAAVAADDRLAREIVTPGPSDGRASRITRCGPWLFVIGVRGETSLATGERAEEETPSAFAQQVRISYDNIAHHLANGGGSLSDVVRFDGFIRDVGRLDELAIVTTDHVGELAAAATFVACPLGGSTDIELSALAIAPGEPRTSVPTGDGRHVVLAGGLAFAPGALGDRSEDGDRLTHLCGDLDAQVINALATIEGMLRPAGADMDAIARLDVYLTDPYQFDRVDLLLRDRFGGLVPPVVRHGVELGPTALVGMTAVAAASGS